MNDPGLNELLKWGVENSSASLSSTHQQADPQQQQTRREPSGLSADALRSLLGGPSDADLMRESMAAITSQDVSLENKMTAFDNFEQLIEGLDNANNMESLGLWTPLIDQLSSEEEDLRRMAAWCVGTAVQNNARGQERLLILNAIPTILRLSLSDPSAAVRKKSTRAVSSAVRNYQPALDAVLKVLPDSLSKHVSSKNGSGSLKIDAGDMAAVDDLVQILRDNSGQVSTDSS